MYQEYMLTKIFIIEKTSQTSLITMIRINPPKNVPITAPCRSKLLRMTPWHREDVTQIVCRQILSSENNASIFYLLKFLPNPRKR